MENNFSGKDKPSSLSPSKKALDKVVSFANEESLGDFPKPEQKESPETKINEDIQSDIVTDNLELEELKPLSTNVQCSTGKPDIDSISVKSGVQYVYSDGNGVKSLNLSGNDDLVLVEEDKPNSARETKTQIDIKVKESEEKDENQFKIFCYGYASLFRDDYEFENSPKPLEMPLPLTLKKGISNIVCGAMHALALSNTGELYSWGADENGAIGRSGGETFSPGKVELEFPVDLISAGGTHSVVANSQFGIVYFWGTFREDNLQIFKKILQPTRLWDEVFLRKNISKIQSGMDHILILSNGKVFSVGNSKTFATGRRCAESRFEKQTLVIAPIKEKNVEDIFAGDDMSFLKKFDKKSGKSQIYAWGKNEDGQLGIGDLNNTFKPTQVKALSDKEVIDVKCGACFTLFLTSSGKLYGCGINDCHQLGLQNENTRIKTPKEINLEGVTSIFAGNNYTFATANGKQYSWGSGDMCLLLNGKEEDKEFPSPIIYRPLEKESVLGLIPGHAFAVIWCGPKKEVCEIDYNQKCFDSVKQKKRKPSKRQPSDESEPENVNKKIKGRKI